MAGEMASFKQLFKAIRHFDLYEESTIYLELLWGLHPQRQNLFAKLKFWFYFVVFTAFLALSIAEPAARWNGIETLGKTDVTSPCCQVLFTIIIYKLQMNALKPLLEESKLFWTIESFDADLQGTLRTLSAKAIFYVYTYKVFILMGISSYYIKPFLGSNRQLGSDWYNVCDLTNNYCFISSVLLQYYSFFVLVWSIFTFDGIFASLTLKVFQQLKMIKYRIEKLNFEVTSEVETTRLINDISEVVDHHGFILDYIRQMDKFYSKILLGEVFSITFSLCIGAFLLTFNGAPTFKRVLEFAFYLSSLFLQLFTYCFGGQFLIDTTESIADALYDTNWWAAEVKVQKCVLLMLVRSQKLETVTVGGVTDINLRMYLSASKTAFSFYTLMNQLYKENDNVSHLAE